MTASLVALMPVYDDWPLIPPLPSCSRSCSFVTRNSRSDSAVIPRRDYADYVAGETRIYP